MNFEAPGKRVTNVPGNHEGYTCDIDITVEKYRESAAGSMIHDLPLC